MVKKKLREIVQYVDGTWLGKDADLDMSVEGISTDSRKLSPDSLFIPLQGERYDGHNYVAAALSNGAIASLWGRNTSVPLPEERPVLLVDDTLEALQRWAHLYRKELDCVVIGITGSNGKTTTKDLVAGVLSAKYRVHHTVGNLNNHIGVPLTILSTPIDTEIAVIEMGMNHFGEIEALSKIVEPNIGIITNIGETHIEYLGSRRGIAKAKLEILSGLRENGVLIYDGEEPLLTESEILQRYLGKKISCGFTDGNQVQGKLIDDRGMQGTVLHIKANADLTEGVVGEGSEEVYEIPIPGKHNAQNALYAITLGTLMKLTPSEIQTGLNQIPRTKMRLELIKGKNGVSIINDAYNASPTSMKASIQFFADLEGWKRKILVLGDMAELGEQSPAFHEEVGKLLDPRLFTKVYVTGERSKHMVTGAKQKGFPVSYIADRKELVAHLQHELVNGTVILIKASRSMELEKIVEHLNE